MQDYLCTKIKIFQIAINFAGPCFGILFSGFLLELGTSSTNVAWIFNLRSFISNISALFLDPLVAEWGWRKVGLVSSLLLSLGFAVSSFANSALYLLCSYSILTGAVMFLPFLFVRCKQKILMLEDCSPRVLSYS